MSCNMVEFSPSKPFPTAEYLKRQAAQTAARQEALAQQNALAIDRAAKARVNFETPLSELVSEAKNDFDEIVDLMRPEAQGGRKVGPGFIRTQIEEKGTMSPSTPGEAFKINS